MTERESAAGQEKSVGQKWVDSKRAEVPEGVNPEVFAKMNIATAAYIDGKMDFGEIYDYFRDLALPDVDSGIEPPDEATFAYIQSELRLMTAEGW